MFLLPLTVRWNSGLSGKALIDMGVKIVFPLDKNHVANINRFILKNRIKTAIFRSYYCIAGFRSCLPLFNRIIVDTHEITYIRQRREMQINGVKSRDSFFRKSKINELEGLKLADTLIAISKPERDIFRKELPGKRIMIIPTPTEVPEKGTVPRKFAERSGLVFFGQYGNEGANDDTIKYFMRKIFPLIKKKIPSIKFHVAGNGADHFHRMGGGLLTHGRVDDIFDELGKYRVFVCPMRYGAGVKKKIVDSMISRTPVVTSSIGVEGIGAKHGREVLVADKPEEFAKKVVKVYNNEMLWNKLSFNAFNMAKRRFGEKTFETAMKKLYGIIDNT